MVGQGKVLLGVIGEALTPLLVKWLPSSTYRLTAAYRGKLGFVCATLGDGVTVSRRILMFSGTRLGALARLEGAFLLSLILIRTMRSDREPDGIQPSEGNLS